VAISIVISSCTDEVGGNANMSTVDFVVHDNDWEIYGTEGVVGYGFAVDLDFPELTNNVIQNGMVSLYMKSGDAWIPVPVYFYYQTNQTLYQGGFFYRMKQGVLSIDYYESDGYTQNPGTVSYRLVIVQPY
jgi:hypothetical protein